MGGSFRNRVTFSLEFLDAKILEWSRSDEPMFIIGKASKLVPFSDLEALGLATLERLKEFAQGQDKQEIYDDNKVHEILQNRIKNIMKTMSKLVNPPIIYTALKERLEIHHEKNTQAKERKPPQVKAVEDQFSFKLERKRHVVEFLKYCRQEYFLRDPSKNFTLRQGLGQTGKKILRLFWLEGEDDFDLARIRFRECLKNISKCEKNKQIWLDRLAFERGREQMPDQDVEQYDEDEYQNGYDADYDADEGGGNPGQHRGQQQYGRQQYGQQQLHGEDDNDADERDDNREQHRGQQQYGRQQYGQQQEHGEDDNDAAEGDGNRGQHRGRFGGGGGGIVLGRELDGVSLSSSDSSNDSDREASSNADSSGSSDSESSSNDDSSGSSDSESSSNDDSSHSSKGKSSSNDDSSHSSKGKSSSNDDSSHSLDSESSSNDDSSHSSKGKSSFSDGNSHSSKGKLSFSDGDSHSSKGKSSFSDGNSHSSKGTGSQASLMMRGNASQDGASTGGPRRGNGSIQTQPASASERPSKRRKRYTIAAGLGLGLVRLKN